MHASDRDTHLFLPFFSLLGSDCRGGCERQLLALSNEVLERHRTAAATRVPETTWPDRTRACRWSADAYGSSVRIRSRLCSCEAYRGSQHRGCNELPHSTLSRSSETRALKLLPHPSSLHLSGLSYLCRACVSRQPRYRAPRALPCLELLQSSAPHRPLGPLTSTALRVFCSEGALGQGLQSADCDRH